MADSHVRHAIARSTGATTYAVKGEDGWTVTCLNHSVTVSVPSRGKAWTTGSYPQDFCPKCKVIGSGKADKITGDRLAAPTAKPVKKATTKSAAPRKAPVATAKSTPTAKGSAAKATAAERKAS